MNTLVIRKKSAETWILILCLLVGLNALREYYSFEFRRHALPLDARHAQPWKDGWKPKSVKLTSVPATERAAKAHRNSLQRQK
jgi:hypothetical protein